MKDRLLWRRKHQLGTSQDNSAVPGKEPGHEKITDPVKNRYELLTTFIYRWGWHTSQTHRHKSRAEDEAVGRSVTDPKERCARPDRRRWEGQTDSRKGS
ncbi:hypothetical protein TNCV_2568311 [Trichonephila clavipes]|uniref:Uncharacterized protein n=1 Tax=Trichonephila clavipes TaxID=2585209 RepID=A0A8X6WMA7_TRICX|nr:hypothetical protein TNCV_2568311 [Trichonephila clavipes]